MHHFDVEARVYPVSEKNHHRPTCDLLLEGFDYKMRCFSLFLYFTVGLVVAWRGSCREACGLGFCLFCIFLNFVIKGVCIVSIERLGLGSPFQEKNETVGPLWVTYMKMQNRPLASTSLISKT